MSSKRINFIFLKHNLQTSILTVLFIALSFSLAAQDLENAVLWKITAPESGKTSWVFGTIHAIPEADFHMPEAVKNRIAQAEVMYQEVDMDDLDQMKILNMMSLPDNKMLSDFLSEEEYEKFKKMLLKYDLKEAQIDYLSTMKPVFSYGLVINSVYKNPVIFEQELVNLAKKNEIEIEGLETLEFQLAIFDSIPIPEQINMFYEKGFSKELKKILKIYLKQDISKMVKMTTDSKMGDLEEALLTRRNQKWADTLQTILPEKSVFIAVGAGHLAGDNGLIPLLQKAGYEVTPVRFEFE